MNTRSLISAGVLLAVLGCRNDAESPTEPSSAGPQPVPQFVLTSNTWITRADMPSSERWRLATAVVSNAAGQSVLYAIGGSTPTGSSLSRVQAYNAATNTWTWKKSLPVALQETNGAAVINGKIYVSGGEMGYGSYSEQLYLYDPARNTWTRKRDMPTPSFRGLTGVIDNKLYVVASCHSQESCVAGFPDWWLYRYNPVSDTWTKLARPPTYIGYPVGGTIGKKLYVGHGGSKILDVYDPVTNTWTQRTTTVAVRGGAAYATLGAKLYMLGGFRRNADGTFTEVRATTVYDPATNLWTNKAAMPTPRSWVSAGRVVVNGRAGIELVGGKRPGNNLQYLP